MLPAATIQIAMRQAVRAYGRTLPSTTSGLVAARGAFLIAPSYKARLAVRGYATATKKATTTAKKPAVKKGRSAAAAKKPAAKKKTTAKSKAKAKAKPKAKAKAKAKTKKVARRPVKRAKREIKPERKALLLKRALRAKAFINQEPKKAATSAWMVFQHDNFKGDKTLINDFSARQKDLGVQYKNLSASEMQRLQERAAHNKVINDANYKKWVETHSVADVAAANNARARLIREFNVKINPLRITDERMPKRPITGFAQFLRAKTTGNAGHGKVQLKTLSDQWKTMSVADKKPYEDLNAAEKIRYAREMQKIAA